MSMSKELHRLATYSSSSWPVKSEKNPITLAKCGFFYNGKHDEVECFQCKTRISSWTDDDNPHQKHRQMAPHCLLLTGNCTDHLPANISLPVPNRAALATKRQTEADGANNLNEKLQPHDETSEFISSLLCQALSRAERNGVFSNTNGCRPTIDRTQPDFGMLQSEAERRSTFHDWPSYAKADPMALAQAGFFYTGTGDHVQCFTCKNVVGYWKPSAVPGYEHKRHFPGCSFAHDLEIPNNSSNDYVVHYEFTTEEIGMRMDTPTVRLVLGMGFPYGDVKKVIKRKLLETGDDFINVESLFLILEDSSLASEIVNTSSEENAIND